MVLMTLLAALFGIEELYALAASSGAALVSAAVWLKRQSRLDLAEVTEVAPQRTSPGARARARIVLADSNLRGTPGVTVSVPLRRASAGDHECRSDLMAVHTPTFFLPGLAPGAQAEATLKLPMTRRGLWVIGPVTATLCDPLGLTEKQWSGRAESYFVVHPNVLRLAVPPQLATTTSPGEARSHLPAQRGEELHTLRDYQDGDNLGQVHWRSTARWDRLMVRQDEAFRKCLVCVGVDLRADRHTPESLESALETAASIACMVLSAGDAELRVTTTHGERRGPGSGTGARAAVLDLLATASVHQELPSVRLFAGRAEITILVSPTEGAALELLAFETTPVLRSVVAVLTNETPPNGEPNVALRHFAFHAQPVVMVRAGHGLEAAWAEAFGRVSRGNAFVTPRTGDEAYASAHRRDEARERRYAGLSAAGPGDRNRAPAFWRRSRSHGLAVHSCVGCRDRFRPRVFGRVLGLPVMASVVAGSVASFFGRRARAGRLRWWPRALSLAIWVSSSELVLGGTTQAGLPLLGTLRAASLASRQAAAAFMATAAPAHAAPGFVLWSAWGAGAAVVASDFLAVRLRSMAAVFPPLLVFLATCVLGLPSGRAWALATFIAATLVFVLVHQWALGAPAVPTTLRKRPGARGCLPHRPTRGAKAFEAGWAVHDQWDGPGRRRRPGRRRPRTCPGERGLWHCSLAPGLRCCDTGSPRPSSQPSD